MMEPESFEAAAKHEVWVQAMKEEIKMIEKNDTWELAERPKDKEVIGVKWIYKTKLNADGSIQKHKARLVAKGYSQLPGYEEKVLRLKKALYGLKQAPRAWYSRIDNYFMDRGFRRSLSEPTLYVKRQGNDTLIVSLYVDDLIYTGNNEKMIHDFKEDMMKTFEMSDLGLMHFFLGIEINQEKEGIFICQKKYTETLLKKFKMESCKTVTTPLVTGEKYKKRRWFRKESSQVHYGAAKRILRYLQGTKDFGIWYKSTNDAKLVGYTDSDWAGSADDMKSTSGYTFSLGSGIFSWASKKQATVAQSSAEAEYIAAAASNQATWLRRILEDMGEKQEEPTTIYCDNKSAIAITKNPVQHNRTKHIDIKYHALREATTRGEIELKYCSTEEQTGRYVY
ncbi:UNVERIFIED_CONTAM: Retrovirus-related Pol polyprotein from transposon RE1 [Sesamum radiatum]|uniref:Retrovirus-related Pol polyprotein from transposon RE1 n=1 Tax=Sesamum radiatum TaxID=300843 RepID=A0AAW2LUH0_SESRA